VVAEALKRGGRGKHW